MSLPSGLTFDEALAEFRSWGTLSSDELLARLKDLLARTSIEQTPEFALSGDYVTMAYSGSLSQAYDGGVPGTTAAQYAAANPGRVAILDNTHAGRLLALDEVLDTLTEALGGNPDVAKSKLA